MASSGRSPAADADGEGKLAEQDSEALSIGVVGTGSFGRNHVRVLSDLDGVVLAGVYDLDATTRRAVAEEYGTRAFDRLDELAEACDAAVLAVPTAAHAAVGCELFAAGLDLLIEKPFAVTLEEADRLLEAGDGRTVAVGHVEFYNPAVQALLELGIEPGFVEVQRRSGFSPRSLDIDVVLDLMIHDLQILHALDPSPVREVRATGISVLSDRVDIANVRLEFESGCVANLTASRVSAERERKLRAFFRRRYYSLDYEQQEIKGYRLEAAGGERRIVPDDLPVRRGEPLRRELEAFAARCRGERIPLVDGEQGRRALQTALWITDIIAETGPVEAGGGGDV